MGGQSPTCVKADWLTNPVLTSGDALHQDIDLVHNQGIVELSQ